MNLVLFFAVAALIGIACATFIDDALLAVAMSLVLGFIWAFWLGAPLIR